MPISLRIGVMVVALLLFIIVLEILKKDRIPVKYSLVWLFSSILLFSVVIFPNLFEKISKLFGFVTISNMIIGIFIFILLLITISLTVIISGQKKKITLIIQELSILKERINNNEK